MTTTDPIESLRDAVAKAPDGRALAREIQHCVDQLNASLADAAMLGLKVEIRAAETFLNAVEERDAHTPAWRVKCSVYQDLGK
jgi:hypothetical protein